MKQPTNKPCLNESQEIMGKQELVLKRGQEQDFFMNEAIGYVIEVLEEYVKNNDAGKRRRKIDVLRDIVKNNDYSMIHEERREKLKKTLIKTDGNVSKAGSVLKELGLSVVSQNSHRKFIYFDDRRYITNISLTPSDRRAVKNCISDIISEML